MTIINLTPHTLNLYRGDEIQEIAPGGPAARVATVVSQVGEVDGVPITSVAYGAVVDLPAPAPGVVYVVSALVQQACPDRTDLLRPDTGPQNVVRNEAGQIVGVRALARL